MKTEKGNRKQKDKVADLNPNILIILLNINGLYIKAKIQRLTEWGQKTLFNYTLFTRNLL